MYSSSSKATKTTLCHKLLLNYYTPKLIRKFHDPAAAVAKLYSVIRLATKSSYSGYLVEVSKKLTTLLIMRVHVGEYTGSNSGVTM